MNESISTVQQLASAIAQLYSGDGHASQIWRLRAVAEERGFTDEDWGRAEEIARATPKTWLTFKGD